MTSHPALSFVQDTITEVEARMYAQGETCHPDLHAALEHLISSGGKRVRPTLVVLIGNMLNAPHDKLVTLGAAVEMLHTATLVHDDLIDGSLLRRGIPTLNARWSPAATVLTGDFVFAQAAKLAAETENVTVIQWFAETLAIIVNGELTQMFTSRGLISRENYYKRIFAKTASLFEMCTRSAAKLSPASDETVENMRLFGHKIGMAFQVVDDILDFTGNQETMGKPLGSDLLQGLVTLPALYYIESYPNDPEVQLLKQGGWDNRERMEKLITSIRNSNAIQRSMQEARDYVQGALELLTLYPVSPERNMLEELTRYIVDREI